MTIEGRPLRPLEPSIGFMRTKPGATFRHDPSARSLPYTEIRERNAPLWVDMTVGCRQCPACLRRRAIHWRERAKVECNLANRTWFGTMTLSPHEHFLAECRAGSEFQSATADEQFSLRHRAISPLITNYVKRLRKAAGHDLRFICVAEAHKSGLPHYHMLAHEPHGGAVLRHRLLKEQWPHGFTDWKLVQDGAKAAHYVAKYLSKSSRARVRASVSYGDPARALKA